MADGGGRLLLRLRDPAGLHGRDPVCRTCTPSSLLLLAAALLAGNTRHRSAGVQYTRQPDERPFACLVWTGTGTVNG